MRQPYSSSRETGRRQCLTWPRRRLASNRRRLAARDGFVLRRGFGFSAALRINSTSRSIASWRFRSWLRNRRAVMINTSSSVTRDPARRFSRSRTSSGREGELRMSNRSCTALAALLTCCPPGPEARMNSSSISLSPITMVGVIWSIICVI